VPSLFSRLRLPSPSQAKRVIERTGISPWRIAGSAGLAAGATVFQLLSLGLFLPLVRSVLGEPLGAGRLGRLLPQGLLTEGEPGSGPWVLVGLILVATAGRVVCGYLAVVVVARERAAAHSKLSSELLRRFLGLGQAYYDGGATKRSAGLVQRLPGQLARGIEVLHEALSSLSSLALFLAALFLLSWPLALAASVALLVYHAFYDTAAERLESMAEQLEEAEDDAAVRTHDLLANLPLVHGHDARDLESARFTARAETLARLRVGQERLMGLLEPLRDTAAVVLLLGFAGLVAALPQVAAASGVTRYLVFLLVFRRALSSASRLLRVPQRWRRLERTLRRFETLDELESSFAVPTGARELTRLRDAIAIEGLSFSYPGGREVLHGLRARFAAGRRTWVVGASGSGKSTLLKLLIRLYDCPPGAIRFDGVDLRDFSLSSLVARVAWAPNDPLFFADTARANLTYGQAGASEQELWHLAEALAVADLLRELPSGLDTDLGERGLRFSSGERQRLALVRLFLRHPEVLLIDEATAGLDAATEQQVLEALDRLMAGCTVVMVAHRLSNLRSDEEVVVLQDGRTIEQGRRDDLLAARGALWTLWSAQGLSSPTLVADR
jgi:ATP-binding cassette, subfamily B, bacterial MsbA